VERKIKIH
jgi:hypothetical protein